MLARWKTSDTQKSSLTVILWEEEEEDLDDR